MNKLKELRKSRNLKQSEVAKAIYTTQQNYSRYEQGLVEPDFETLKKLAIFFDVTIDYILGKEASELILISKEDFQKLKEASEIIQKIDKTYNNSNYFSTGDIQIGNNNNNIAIGNNTNIKDSFNKK